MGVYRRVVEDDGIDSMVYRFAYDFTTANQKSIAEYYVNDQARMGDKFRREFEERWRADTMLLVDASDIKWNSVSQQERLVWMMVACLIETNYAIRVSPVEFVRFDEDLYQLLVSMDWAISRRGVRGQVELEAAALHISSRFSLPNNCSPNDKANNKGVPGP